MAKLRFFLHFLDELLIENGLATLQMIKLDKKGGISEIKIKNSVIDFIFRSIYTIFCKFATSF